MYFFYVYACYSTVMMHIRRSDYIKVLGSMLWESRPNWVWTFKCCLLLSTYPGLARFQKNLKSMFWKYVKSRQWSPLAEAKSMHQIWVSWYFHSRYATWQERSFSRSHFRRRGPTSGMQGSKYATNRLLSASWRSTAAVRLRFRDYWRRRRRQV